MTTYREEALDRIGRTKLMCAFRGNFTTTRTIEICEILLANGLDIFELTMTSQEPIETLKTVARHFKDTALVSMGTVLSPHIANEAIDAGAAFVLSPGTKIDVLKAVHARDRLFCGGVLTVTECMAAWDNDVRLLKLFPVGPLGVNYFKSLRATLGHMNFLCDGGMDTANVPEFLTAGAFSCGIVEALTGGGTEALEEIDRRAKILVKAVKESSRRETIAPVMKRAMRPI